MAIGRMSFWRENQVQRARAQQTRDELEIMTALTEKMANASANSGMMKSQLAGMAAKRRVDDAITAKKASLEAESTRDQIRDREMENIKFRLEVPSYMLPRTKVDVKV